MLTRRDVEDCNWTSKAYSTSTQISRCPRTLIIPPIPKTDSYPPFCFIGEPGTKLVRMLLAIPGVAAIWIGPYCFEIIKIREVDWQPIENGVAAVLAQLNISAEEALAA